MKPPPRKHARPKPLRPRKLEQQGTHSREGGCAVVRPGYRLVIVLAVLIVALVYLAPAYAQSPPHDTAGQPPPPYGVEAGTQLTVLGRYHEPDPNSKCPPLPRDECKPHTWAVVRLPNKNVVLLPPDWVDYQTQTVRFDSETSKPLTPGQVREILVLSDTGGVAIPPLLGAVVLTGSVLLARRMVHRNSVG
jgi:hypothetical protein